MIDQAVNFTPATEQASRSTSRPTSPTERIASIDVLRGFALLGILLANIQDFAAPSGMLHDIPIDLVSGAGMHHKISMCIMIAQWLFVEGKMRSLFGLLLGAGTVLLLGRIETRTGAARAADIFHRRYMWLILLGLIHGIFIWNGDILFQYGVIALLTLYPLRHVKASRLIFVGFAIALLGGTLGIGNAMGISTAMHSAALQEGARATVLRHQAPTLEQQQAVDAAQEGRNKDLAALQESVSVERAGYLKSEPENAKGFAEFNFLVVRTGWIFEVVGIMIAGMGLYKTGYLSAAFPSRIYFAVAHAGYIVSGGLVLIGFNHAAQFGFSDAVTVKWIFLPYGLEQVSGMLANASVLLLLVRHGILKPAQRALAAVGRTALSNYLLTSIICQFVFKWGPWKLFGTLDYYQQIYAVVCVWAFNIAASMIWLRFFIFGPVEWIWRSLTYWKRQPILAEA
jgi:uncharacterized protein